MIIAKLQGGLGNQLFQWALTHTLSAKYNTSYAFDTSFYNHNILGITTRNYQLSSFPNIITKASSNINYSRVSDIIREKSLFYYQEINIRDNEVYYLDGYWQSYKYFKEYSNEIASLLDTRLELDSQTRVILETETVSLHVRRSDYLLHQNVHHVQDKSYYDRALKLVPKYDHMIVFSDDIDWCKKNLDYPNMVFMENTSDIMDLTLMSKCKHNIIANSSFSWWGAWLNQNTNKTVVCPRVWFAEYVTKNTELCPPEWITI
jgi:hypothetical protein